ncbi:ribosomal protein S6--L-glutamate ligase [Zhouia amylolytica]|uniref:Probable alpha-L-glutamate ligase n=2 Tax=Zhouia amylolytica TaxID=376730 RepID=W2UQZ2_9FLAO|nr:30S ribosomal protein S6--L-glutamate ligase [Zhouia amylolytica]ETN96438.1 alpha-L-glutamate ligase, RimK family [Zhouia amylolytica AD3]MCQ0112681.1 30S ribosomal protein S6--L-glutamate ligase [Zhouia amylolytica]SFS83319.1 ribosomal protein S6--L-glutamate ligase [Zhouia amylolytica]
MVDDKIIVGSEEWFSLPDLDIPAVKARIDSGAKTSSLHAVNIEPFKKGHETWVSFDVFPIQYNGKKHTHCTAKVIDKRIVKSSTGNKENRFVIRTTLKSNDFSTDIEVTLTNRDSMGYRMLLGREAMMGRMLVDPEQGFLLGEMTDEEIDKAYNTNTNEKTGLKIGLLASNPNLYSNRRIMEAAERLGHTVDFYNIRQCYIKLNAEAPEIHYRGGLILNELDAIIPRIRPSLTYYGCALTTQFENLGVLCLNKASAISKSRDKLYSLQLLLNSGIDIPTTGFANSPLDTNDLIKMVGGSPLIIKLLEGTQGKGVVLAETKKAAESVINAFKSLNANILVQEFVKEAEGKDIRCFVIDGKVVASMQRTAPPGEFRANVHLGGTTSVVKITAEERKLAIKATKAMGLHVAGVDIIRSSKGPLLLEVNSSPGLEGIETASEKDIASLMIKSIERNLNWKHS